MSEERNGCQVRVLHRVRRVGKNVVRLFRRPWITQHRLESDLRALGVQPGRILLVHSSLSSLGYVIGAGPTVLRALLAVLGPDGTLVLPTHSWEATEGGCRIFDVRHTGSCVGRLTDEFRKMPGVLRSLHPTHSVAALGPLAGWLTQNHHRCATPCGAGTPYAKSLDSDCQILFLGTGLESNTAFHTVEALAQVPYLMLEQADEFVLVDEAGGSQRACVWRHRPRVSRRFAALEDLLVDQGIVRRRMVGPARSLLLEGDHFKEYLLDLLLHVDPAFLLAPGANGHRT